MAERSVGMNRLPSLTHLQFLLLSLIAGGSTAETVRGRLAEFGYAASSPTFYQLLRRLEHLELANCTEGVYRVTDKGNRQHHATLSFYNSATPLS